MSVLQRGDRLGVSELPPARVGRWVFAEVERDLISESTRARALPGPSPRGRARETPGSPFRAARRPKSSFMSTRGLKPSPYRVFLHESGRYPLERTGETKWEEALNKHKAAIIEKGRQHPS